MAPGAEEFLLKAAEGEEGPEGVTHGVHAQTACNPQRHALSTVAAGRVRVDSRPRLHGGRLFAGITGGGLDDREGRRLGSPLRGERGRREMMLEGEGRFPNRPYGGVGRTVECNGRPQGLPLREEGTKRGLGRGDRVGEEYP